MIQIATRIALAATILLPSACISMEYGPITPDQPYGYTEKKREDGAYVLGVVYPDSKQAMAFWDKRATELCGPATYTKNIYEASRVIPYYSSYASNPGLIVLEGLLTCNAPEPVAEAAQ